MIAVKSICAIFFCTLHLVVGLPGNGLIIAVYAKRKPKMSTDILIIAQAAVDLIAALLAPINILQAVVINFKASGTCKLTLYGNEMLAFSSLCFTAAIALDRYKVVCRSFGSRPTNLRATILACISISLGALLPIMSLIDGIFDSEAGICVDASGGLEKVYASLKTVVFAVTLVGSTVLYGLIYHTIRRQARIRDRMKDEVRIENGESETGFYRSVLDQETETKVVNIAAGKSSTVHRDENGTATERNSSNEMSHGSEQLGTAKGARGASFKLIKTRQDTIPYTSAGKQTDDEQSQSKHDDVHISESGAMVTNPSSIVKKHHHTRPPMLESARARGCEGGSDSATTHPPVDHRRNRAWLQKGPNREHRTTAMLLAVTIFLLLTWLPSVSLFYIGEHVIEIIHSSTTLDGVVFLARRLPAFNHIINYFVYMIMNRRFRNDSNSVVRRLLCRKG